MAKNDDGFYHTLRLSRRNPTHIKIHQILADLDKSVYKSQNQFIADAVEYYINALENDFITNDDREKREENFVTKSDIQKMKEDIKNEILSEVNKQMLSVLGSFTGNLVRSSNQNETEQKDEFSADDTLLGLAEMWGNMAGNILYGIKEYSIGTIKILAKVLITICQLLLEIIKILFIICGTVLKMFLAVFFIGRKK